MAANDLSLDRDQFDVEILESQKENLISEFEGIIEEDKAEEPESNFSLNLNVNNEIGNGAWDLVKAYKNRK